MDEMEQEEQEMINYQFYHWGPLLCRFDVSKDSVGTLLKHGTKKESYGYTLAGVIEEEFKYPQDIFMDQMRPYLDAYSGLITSYYNTKEKKKIKLSSTPWINYMVAGEFNPPHTHPNGHFSCVLFLQIPEVLKKENEDYKGKSAGPGGLMFRYGERGYLSVTTREFFPKVGDFFIFPGDLMHWVFPFKSKGERISLSANFKYEVE